MKRTAIVLALIFLVDLGVLGQGVFSLMIAIFGLTVLVVGALLAFMGARRALAASRLGRAGLYVLLGIATVGASRLQAATMERQATRVIQACRGYQAKNGSLPERLQDLVPEYFPAVPKTKYAMMYRDFMYWAAGDHQHHTLMYVAFPPFGRRLYHFEEDRWTTLD